MKPPPLIPGWLLLLTACAILAAIMVTTGCASIQAEDLTVHEERHCEGWTHTGREPFYVWAKTREASLKPWFYLHVEDTDKVCRSIGADLQRTLSHIAACAQWQPQGCIIVLPVNP